MKPAQVSACLRKIAEAINRSESPRINLVLEDLRLLLAFGMQPKAYFVFPTGTKVPGPWGNPIFLENMLDQAKDDFSLAQIYGDVIGTYQKDDFYWVIEIEADDEDLITELLELGIAYEIPESDVNKVDNIDPLNTWWESFGQNIPGAEMAYPDTCLPSRQT